jgi:hypothetical protein
MYVQSQTIVPPPFIKDLLIWIFGLEFFIIVIILKMEGLNNKYSMLLGRLELQQANVNHD